MAGALVICAVGPEDPQAGKGGRRSRLIGEAARLVPAWSNLGYEETIVIVSDEHDADTLGSDATVVLDESADASEASAIRACVDYCAREGHHEVTVVLARLASRLPPPAQAFAALSPPPTAPITLCEVGARFCGLVRFDEEVWPLLPLEGRLDSLWGGRPELVTGLEIGPEDVPEIVASARVVDYGDDYAAVAVLLGREPSGPFRVVVRDRLGAPVVIENAPFLDDLTPMPTRYWLVGEKERQAVGRLEAAGGARAAEEAIGVAAIAAAHARYAQERDDAISSTHVGPRPSGGVGGTRVGVKCLHAHLAYYLAGEQIP